MNSTTSSQVKHSIVLSKRNGQWVATHSDPMILDLFGTDTIECGFSGSTPASTALSEISKLNPEANVSLL